MRGPLGTNDRIQTSLRPDATATMIGRYCSFDRMLLQLASQAIATMHLTRPVIPISKSGQCAEIRMKGVTTILALRSIQGVCGYP
jgi:hypothetical protein